MSPTAYSIPKITFIVFDPMLLEQGHELFFERRIAVMLLLVPYVITYGRKL